MSTPRDRMIALAVLAPGKPYSICNETGEVTWLEGYTGPTDAEIEDWIARNPARPDTSIVKAEAARRILSVYPDYRQANMTARFAELSAKFTDQTAEDVAEMEKIRSAWTYIRAVRDASNAIEISPSVDVAADARWPQVPQ